MRDKPDHRVLAIKEFQDHDYEDLLKRPVFCPIQGHQKEELKYFCKTCQTAVCQTCVTLEHGGHTLKLITEEADSQKIEMTAMVQAQRHNLQAKINEVTELDEDCTKLIQQGENVKAKVERFAGSLIATIQAKKQNIIARVESQTRKSLESLTTKKTKIQEQIKVMESSREKADQLLTRSTDAELVQLKKSFETMLQGIVQTEPITHDILGAQALVFVENQKVLDIVNSEEIGCLEIAYLSKARESFAEGKGLNEGTVWREAQFNLNTRNAERRQWYDKRDRVTVEIRDEQGRECVTEVRIADDKDGVYNISYSLRVQGRCKLSIKVNGQHIRNNPFSVQMKPFHVKPILTFGKQGSAVGMFLFPQGVAVSNSDVIAVAEGSNHRVQIFNSNGNLLRSFGRQGNNRGEFICPCGIAFDKDFNHRIQRFSWKGRYMGMFGGEGKLDSQLSYPWGLSLDGNGNIIVADRGKKLIKIFSTDGKFIMKIGRPGTFSNPVHCVQCGGYLIVPDYGDHNIKVFSREGEFQYKFGKQGGGDGEFNGPRFLSVTKSGHLMVFDSNNHRIQVFEGNGTFIGKFGTNGTNLGECRNPFSVAFLKNDQIVVSDYGNHRSQIFDRNLSSAPKENSKHLDILIVKFV